jgi:hypothetical protein
MCFHLCWPKQLLEYISFYEFLTSDGRLGSNESSINHHRTRNDPTDPTVQLNIASHRVRYYSLETLLPDTLIDASHFNWRQDLRSLRTNDT